MVTIIAVIAENPENDTFVLNCHYFHLASYKIKGN